MKRIIPQLIGILLTAFTFSSVEASTLFQLAGSATVEAVDEAPSSVGTNFTLTGTVFSTQSI
jgi:hypothetical protein